MARLAYDSDRSAVGFNDSFHQAESEAQTPLGSAGIAPEQPVPYSCDLVRGNAGARVSNDQESAVAVAPHLHRYPAPGGCVLHRIVEEIGGDLLEPHTIAFDDGERIGVGSEIHTFGV